LARIFVPLFLCHGALAFGGIFGGKVSEIKRHALSRQRPVPVSSPLKKVTTKKSTKKIRTTPITQDQERFIFLFIKVCFRKSGEIVPANWLKCTRYVDVLLFLYQLPARNDTI